MVSQLGALAGPLITTRVDYRQTIAVGLGVTEYAQGGRAACEIKALWTWIENRLGRSERHMPTQMGAFKKGWAMIASTTSVERREAAHGRPYDHDRQVVFKMRCG
jgi:hypothetical protein